MGTYDVNLKKNKLGYQFDRNVYIGQQVNDNRVVTVKELNNFSGAAVSVAGSVADIDFVASTLTATPASGYDQLTFSKNGTSNSFPIVPQYQKFATAPSDATVYICAAAPDSNDISSLYKTNLVPGQAASSLYLFGKTYDGTAAVTFNYGGGLKIIELSRTTVLSVDAVSSITAGTAGSSIVNVEAVRSAVNGMFSYDSTSGILTIISLS